MKLWTKSLAVMALASPLVATATAAFADGAAPASAPPQGRSLFDFLVSDPDGSAAPSSGAHLSDGNPLADAAWAAFKGNCQVSGCHAEYKSAQWMVDKKKVLAGNVAGSKIMGRILNDKDMPQDADGNPVPLPAEALNAFTAWIQAGVPTTAPSTGPVTPTGGNDAGTTPVATGGAKYNVPFPFDQLITTLSQRAQGSIANQPNLPTMLLLPNGRSLQRDHTDAANPRVVAAFTDHPARANDVSLSLRDRLFIGYAAKANQLEVISYNEDAGRFEFQIVTDYREGGQKRVMYANRAFCMQCHKAQVPLFSKNTWDETNANLGVVSAILKSSDNTETFFNLVRTRGNKGSAYAFDTSTDRAGRLPVVNSLWRKGCSNASGNMTPETCRAGIFAIAMAGAAGVDLPVAQGVAAYDDIAKVWKASLSELDMKIFLGNLENRNPSGYQDVQILQIPQESDRIELWTKNLAKNRDFDAAHDPKQMPVEAYTYVEDIDHAKQALDLTIAVISGMVTSTERTALPKDGAQIAQAAAQSTGAADKPYADAPLRKGALMGNFFKNLNVTTLAGQPLSVAFQKRKTAVPPIDIDDGSAATGSGLFVIVNNCSASCHGVQGFSGNIDFLHREAGATDEDLWKTMIKREKGEFCRRLNWSDPSVDVNTRMPRGPRSRAM